MELPTLTIEQLADKYRTERKTNSELAAIYKVSPRTIQRYRRAGVDLTDPESVAKHILRNAGQSIESLQAVITELKK